MRKKIALLLALLTVMSAVFVPVGLAADDYVAITLSQNKCAYLGEDASNVPLTVLGIKADGSTEDITDQIPYFTSTDDSVFKTTGKNLNSFGKNGKAIITAPYKKADGTYLYGKIMMVRQDQKTAADQAIAPLNPAAAYKVTGTPGTAEGGHIGGTSITNLKNNWTVRIAYISAFADNKDVTSEPSSAIHNRWFDAGYRSMMGWFYDDGSADYETGGNALGFAGINVTDSVLFHENFAADYGYGEFAEKWEGMNSYAVLTGTQLAVNTGNNCYTTGYYFADEADWSIAPRTKGWHQFVVSLEKNPDAPYGWTVYSYLDGNVIGKGKNVIPKADKIATTGDGTGVATLEMRANSPTDPTKTHYYYDEMIPMGSLDRVDDSHTLTGTIGEHGSVTVNGTAFADGAALKLNPEDALSIQITPEEGYEIDQVKLGDAVFVAAAEINTIMPDEDVTLTVTFRAKPAQPTVSGDAAYNYFKTENGEPTAYVYGKVNDYYNPSLEVSCGMKVWVKDDREHAITLPARENESTLSKAQPGFSFAIKVFGPAITQDQAYVFQPYVGEAVGTEQTLEFKQN